mgnify:CR=1 FL=1
MGVTTKKNYFQKKLFFSKIDLTQAFLQILLNEQTKKLNTINIMWVLYQYNFLPFGLSVSPNIFQTTINEVIKGIQGVRAYQDDLIVFGKSSDEHRRNLKQLLERLKQFNVKINASKSIFGVQKIKYLGYCIDRNGITPDQERIQPIIKAPKPTTMNQLKSFLGFMQYYSKFLYLIFLQLQNLYSKCSHRNNSRGIRRKIKLTKIFYHK